MHPRPQQVLPAEISLLLRPSPSIVPRRSPQCWPSTRRHIYTSPTRHQRLLNIDPFSLVAKELGSLRGNVKKLLGSGHPALDRIAKYYFQAEGKHIRPLIVLLVSQATNGLSPHFQTLQSNNSSRSENELSLIDEPISPPNILNDSNPDSSIISRAGNAARAAMDAVKFIGRSVVANGSQTITSSASTTSSLEAILADKSDGVDILPTQIRLAEITEMIHVASLLHDDVIDASATRRSHPSSPAVFGNKLSILAGDFLLARASLAVSRLGSNEVVELVASVLANLVEGEVMQMKGNSTGGETGSDLRSPPPRHLYPSHISAAVFDSYLKKTYLKTASLIAKSARAAVVLGGCGLRQGWEAGERIKDVAYRFGENLGMAFQLVDDLLDFTSTAATMGKPSGGTDLKLGLATAPVLYAWQDFPELKDLIDRKFEQAGDAERARDLVLRSSGPSKTLELATHHANAARDAIIEGLPPSKARDALEGLTAQVLNRKK